MNQSMRRFQLILLIVALMSMLLGPSAIGTLYAFSVSRAPGVLSGKLDIETFTPFCALKFSQCRVLIYSMPVLVVGNIVFVLTPEFDASVRDELIASVGSHITIVGHIDQFDVGSMTRVWFCQPYSCSSLSSTLVFVVHFQNAESFSDLYVRSCHWLPVRCVD
jgi:hypothetical protein